MIYLDNASTTKMYPEVIEAVMDMENNYYGNPGSKHIMGELSRRKLKAARENVAALINAEPDQVVFTSGGSESNNLVFQGVQGWMREQGKSEVLISCVEHHSIKRVAGFVGQGNIIVKECSVNQGGKCDISEIEDIIKNNNIGLVSIMYVNNELGSINDVASIGRICKENGVLFHVDCVQALGAIKVSMKDIGCDFASFSAHKIHGPKGVGALYIKDRSLIHPIIFGGNSQEFGLRGGTENVPGVVGFGIACKKIQDNLKSNIERMGVLKNEFIKHLKTELSNYELLDALHINEDKGFSNYVSKVLNIRIDGVDAETLVIMAGSGKNPVCISAGSACEEYESKPSEVLLAIGLSPTQARESVRISFSDMNDINDIKVAARKMSSVIQWLKGVA